MSPRTGRYWAALALLALALIVVGVTTFKRVAVIFGEEQLEVTRMVVPVNVLVANPSEEYPAFIDTAIFFKLDMSIRNPDHIRRYCLVSFASSPLGPFGKQLSIAN